MSNHRPVPVLLVLIATFTTFTAFATAHAADSSHAAGRFAFVLDGESVGFVRSHGGGHAKGEVATHDVGSDPAHGKQLASVTLEPLSIEVDPATLSPDFADWMSETLAGYGSQHDVSIAELDAYGRALTHRELQGARITELRIPTLDASAKEGGAFGVVITPESIAYRSASTAKVADTGSRTKKWLPSNFRVELGSLPTARVSKIDSFTIKQGIVEDEVGAFREPTKHPSKLEVPNLTVSLALEDAAPWQAWFESFVVEGRSSDADELNGAIEFLAADQETVLGRIELANVGIISLSLAKSEANKDEVRRIEVEVYVEGMKLELSLSDD